MATLGYRRAIASAGALAMVGFSLLCCEDRDPEASDPPSTPLLAVSAPSPSQAPSLQERIAKGLAERSPMADPTDPKARDAAGERLAQFDELLKAAGEEIFWGGFDPAKGYDPAAHKLTKFHPVVWAKLYLSTFMFPGDFKVRTEGQYTVLEIAAKFRSKLDDGDYPYPFWHSAKKWQAYIDTAALVLVFDKETLIAGYRKLQPEPGRAPANKPWDEKWYWTDKNGARQPHVALYTYMFSADNPHVKGLDTAYRNLEGSFRAQNCASCHDPSNIVQAGGLTMLNYPNQALAARHSLKKMLSENKMPPKDEDKGTPEGIHDNAAREELIKLAEIFEKEADAALAFEQAKKVAPK